MLSRSDAAKLSSALTKAHLSKDSDASDAIRTAFEAGVTSAIFEISMLVNELSGGRVDGVAFHQTALLTESHFADLEAQIIRSL